METMDRAKAIIAASPGFLSLRVERCVEQPSSFLLLVEWETLEAHTEGFRNSDAYQEWRALLHHFYDPFPVVEHFETVVHGLSARAGGLGQHGGRPSMRRGRSIGQDRTLRDCRPSQVREERRPSTSLTNRR